MGYLKSGFFNSTNLILIFILLLALFFRTARFESFYYLDHDHDLLFWVVKDIYVDHHLRLIGNLTRIEGIFIGPLYYYLLIPPLALFNMNPTAAAIPAVAIGLLTAISIYFVFGRFFGRPTGIIGTFIYAVSLPLAFFDRVPYPTQPVILWSVWYLYLLFALLKKDKKALLLGGILIGLIWHIHIVLLPLVPLIFLAVWLSGQRPKIKDLVLPALAAFILTLPFWIFELRHGFYQLRSMLSIFSYGKTGTEISLARLLETISGGSTAFVKPFTYNFPVPFFLSYIFIVLTAIVLKGVRLLSAKQIILILSWIFLSILSQFFSQRSISNYYFDNLIVVSLLLSSSLLGKILQKGKIWNIIVLAILTGFFFYNLISFLKKPSYENGYLQKKLIVEHIKKDVTSQNYPCIGVTYVASPGAGVGFRYLFWLSGIDVIQAGLHVPTYNITIPVIKTDNEIRFGGLGLIMPEMKKFNDRQVCDDPKNQLLPLLGFTS